MIVAVEEDAEGQLRHLARFLLEGHASEGLFNPIVLRVGMHRFLSGRCATERGSCCEKYGGLLHRVQCTVQWVLTSVLLFRLIRYNTCTVGQSVCYTILLNNCTNSRNCHEIQRF